MRDRDYKTFRSGYWYHVYNRGNNKQETFIYPEDYLNFIKRSKITLGILPNPALRNLNIKPLPLGSLSIGAYCLMPNHYHFLIRQNSEVTIDRFIAKTCTSYATYFNKKYGKVGNLFQDAFKAKLVETDEYFLYLSAYIHLNPSSPYSYNFSSLPDVLGKRQGTLCDKNKLLEFFQNDPSKYEQFLSNFSEEKQQRIKHLLFDQS